MIINGIKVHVSAADIYPHSHRTKSFMENALEKVIKNKAPVSRIWTEVDIEFEKNLYRVKFSLLGISSYFCVNLSNFYDFIKFQELLNISHESTDEQVDQIKNYIAALDA